MGRAVLAEVVRAAIGGEADLGGLAPSDPAVGLQLRGEVESCRD